MNTNFFLQLVSKQLLSKKIQHRMLSVLKIILIFAVTNYQFMAKKLTRKDKLKLYERMSRYLEDISKLIFAGTVLSSIMKEDISMWWLVGCGTIVSLLALYGAYSAYVKSRK